MDTATIIILGAILATAAHVGVELAVRGRLRRRTVIVVLEHGNGAFRGVLWRQTSRHLELRNAHYLDGETPVATDGSVIIDRKRVAWIQNLEEL